MRMRTSHDAPDTKDRARHWADDAACRNYVRVGGDVFFPDTYTGRDLFTVKEAKQICARCPVLPECLEYALVAREPDGVWGGLTPEERRALIRRDTRRDRGGPSAAA